MRPRTPGPTISKSFSPTNPDEPAFISSFAAPSATQPQKYQHPNFALTRCLVTKKKKKKTLKTVTYLKA